MTIAQSSVERTLHRNSAVQNPPSIAYRLHSIATYPLRPFSLVTKSLSFNALRSWRNWQTRMAQDHVGAIPWRFKSSRPHCFGRLGPGW